jgi:hypothetical protein
MAYGLFGPGLTQQQPRVINQSALSFFIYLFFKPKPTAQQGVLNPAAQVFISDDDVIRDILKHFYSLERPAFEAIKSFVFGPGSLGDVAKKFLEESKTLTGYINPVQLITDLSYANEDQIKVVIPAIAAVLTFRNMITR